MSNTTQALPARSARPPVCFSGTSGRLRRSSRKSVRSASTGASVSAPKKRERVERAGSRSRRNLRHERDGKGLKPLVERLQRAFPAHGVAEEDHEKVDGLVASEAPPRKAHLLGDGV